MTCMYVEVVVINELKFLTKPLRPPKWSFRKIPCTGWTDRLSVETRRAGRNEQTLIEDEKNKTHAGHIAEEEGAEV